MEKYQEKPCVYYIKISIDFVINIIKRNNKQCDYDKGKQQTIKLLVINVKFKKFWRPFAREITMRR